MKQEGAEKPLAEQPSKAEAQEQPGPAGAEVKLEHSLEPNQLREEKSEELPVEKWLWIDPLGADATLKSGAVLLAEDIARYVKGYNLLINRNDFEQGPVCGARLKGASYTMTPHPDDASMFRQNDAGVVEEVALERGCNSDGDYYVVPKNSLVFIKLKQELRVPYYMIGRHNLKINYVYRG